jgi:hypothetical protein
VRNCEISRPLATVRAPLAALLRSPDLHLPPSGRPDLNRRPLDPQSSALPNCATSRCRRQPTGQPGQLHRRDARPQASGWRAV